MPRAVLSTRPNTSEDDVDELVTARAGTARDPGPGRPAAAIRPAGRGSTAPAGWRTGRDTRPARAPAGGFPSAEYHRVGPAVQRRRPFRPAGRVHHRGD